jgi:hypothetical protein
LHPSIGYHQVFLTNQARDRSKIRRIKADRQGGIEKLPSVEIVCPAQNFQKSLPKRCSPTEEARTGMMISFYLRDE